MVLVFVTTMRQYAIQGYEVDACDFLVKPVTYPEFALKFTRILGKVPQQDADTAVFLKSETSFVRLSSRDILYVEVKGHHCIYHTAGGAYRHYQTMKSAQAALPADSFARCKQLSSGQPGPRLPPGGHAGLCGRRGTAGQLSPAQILHPGGDAVYGAARRMNYLISQWLGAYTYQTL